MLRGGVDSVRTVAGRALLVCAALLLVGCGDLHYLMRAAGGHVDVLRRARPVEDWLREPGLDAELARRLRLAREFREFATARLGLPDNASYTRYADLGRPYAVWNVVAAPELSLEPKQWCFVLFGCVSYRGYRTEAEAREHAGILQAEGWDTYVYGVPAYSTLGWLGGSLSDPLLNTFIGYEETDLGRLIFHELAHQVVYVPDDTVFNESFATAVEIEGVETWLAMRADQAMSERYRRRQEGRRVVRESLADAKLALQQLYASNLPESDKRRRKAEILALAGAPSAGSPQAGRSMPGLNNARLAAFGAYHELVPGFRALLQRSQGDFPTFYAAVRELASLPSEERRRQLAVAVPAGAAGEP